MSRLLRVISFALLPCSFLISSAAMAQDKGTIGVSMPTRVTPDAWRWSTSSGASAAKSSLKRVGSGNVSVAISTRGALTACGSMPGVIRAPRLAGTRMTSQGPR